MLNSYNERINKFNQELRIQEQKSSQFTWLRSITFLIFLWSLYAQFQMELGRFFWVVPIILFFLFLKFVGLSGAVKSKVKLLQQLVRVNQAEIKYLDRQLDGLSDGQAYQDSSHFFAYDLDVFGHNSLFQHINRTALKEGADKLAFWLKNPLFDVKEIKKRQDAISELKGLIDFRQNYQTEGELDDLSAKKLDNNLSLNASFVRSKYFYLIFIFPVITVTLFVLSFFDVVPVGYAYAMVVIQLLITFVFNMKLRTADEGLTDFAKKLSPYIRLIQSNPTIDKIDLIMDRALAGVQPFKIFNDYHPKSNKITFDCIF